MKHIKPEICFKIAFDDGGSGICRLELEWVVMVRSLGLSVATLKFLLFSHTRLNC